MNTTEIVQPNLFPFPFPHHLIFCCVAMVFFAFMYIKYKKPYQFIMSGAIPFSLIIWLSDSRTLFYTVGAIEVAFLLIAITTTAIHKKKYPELYIDPKKNKEDEESEDDEETADADTEE